MGRFLRAIRGKNAVSVIAEVKIYSPSYGKEFPQHSIESLVHSYEKGHAAAISVVTAADPFRGSADLLTGVRALTDLPILRKDFLTTEDDISKSASLGADAVLLIAERLDDLTLKNLCTRACEKNLDVVLEVHTQDDIKKAQKILKKIDASPTGHIIIGINNRNLKNFSTDVGHALPLLESFDVHQPIIAESSFREPKDLIPYHGKIDAVLIGTALLISPHPLETLESFTKIWRK